MRDSQRRVLVIGLDGATFDLILPWAAAGYLPNLARLMADGCHCPLLSTLQPISAPAWVTYMTGVNQAKHGLFDFVQRCPDDYGLTVTNASNINAPTLYEIASQQGGRIITVNVPFTSPPRPLNGVMIGGPFAPALTRDLVYPTAYFDVLKEIAPHYFILPDYNSSAADPLSDYASQLLQGIALREKVSLHLLQDESWDLFQVVFMAPDEAQHTYWEFQQTSEQENFSRYQHVIRDVYHRLDQSIGRILEQITTDRKERETVVIIMSDHGGGSLNSMINLNRWLSDAGYLSFHASTDPNLWAKTRSHALQTLAHAYRRYVPAKIRSALRTKLGAERFGRIKGNLESALLTSNVDWSQTRAYSIGSGGNIFFNLSGREPAGVVQPGSEYEYLCQEISERLMGLVDPETGKHVVGNVYRREEIYEGPFLHLAPDLIIEWRDYMYWGRANYDPQSSVFEKQRHFDLSDQPLSGAHRMEGILIAYGSGVRSAGAVSTARLFDLAPTILGLLGLPIPAYMDGDVLSALFEDSVTSNFTFSDSDIDVPSRDAFVYSSEEEAEIMQHLKNLGYL